MNICRDLVNATDSSRKPPAVRELVVSDSQPQLLKAQWLQPVKNFVCNVDMYKIQVSSLSFTNTIEVLPSRIEPLFFSSGKRMGRGSSLNGLHLGFTGSTL